MSSPSNEALQSRLRQMPKHVLWLLQYAACLGPVSFSKSTLDMVWQSGIVTESRLEDGTRYEITPLLDQCEKERLIEKRTDDGEEYKWVDAMVHQAAMTLLNESRTSEFRFRAGMALYLELSEKNMEEELEEKLFMVADLLNNADGQSTQKSEECASINLRAARKAKDLSRYASASLYAAKGISRLPAGKRLSDAILALELYTLGAQMEMRLGNAHRVETYTTAFLSVHRDWTVMEAMPLKITRFLSKVTATVEESSSLSKYEECIDECLLLLTKEMNYRLYYVSRRLIPLQARWARFRTTQAVQNRKRKLVSVDNKNAGTDERHEATAAAAAAALLCLIHHAACQTNNASLAALCTCKTVQLSLQHSCLHDVSGIGALGHMVGDATPTELNEIGFILKGDGNKISSDVYLQLGLEPNSQNFSPKITDGWL
ncbi:MAG: hypothetical protein SGBAC_010637 [Bacillariaceae sp.]